MSDALITAAGERIAGPDHATAKLQSNSSDGKPPKPPAKLVANGGLERQPKLVPASEACHIAGVSLSFWWKMYYSGRIPKPLRLGRKLLWRVADIEKWIADGCPPASKWKADEYRREHGAMLNGLAKGGTP